MAQLANHILDTKNREPVPEFYMKASQSFAISPARICYAEALQAGLKVYRRLYKTDYRFEALLGLAFPISKLTGSTAMARPISHDAEF